MGSSLRTVCTAWIPRRSTTPLQCASERRELRAQEAFRIFPNRPEPPRNVLGPLMVLKHFAPLLKASETEGALVPQAPKSTAVFYSARMGSIGDNVTGCRAPAGV